MSTPPPRPLPSGPRPRRLDKHVVIDLVHTGGDRFARAIEHRVERPRPLPLEVLTRGPVVRFEGARIGPPLEVVAQLMRERLPRLLAPVEIPAPPERRERAVIEHDPRLQVRAGPAPLEGNAFPKRVDVAPHRIGHGLGAHLHRYHSLEIRWRYVLQEPRDQLPKVIQPHGRPTRP